MVVPLIYAVSLLVIDLRLRPRQRSGWEWNVGIATFRVFLYNFITTVLLIVFSPRL